MKVQLLKDSRVNAKAGDTVNVSPADAAFLLSLGIAEEVKPKKKKAEE